jgi:hypothetical protein
MKSWDDKVRSKKRKVEGEENDRTNRFLPCFDAEDVLTQFRDRSITTSRLLVLPPDQFVGFFG